MFRSEKSVDRLRKDIKKNIDKYTDTQENFDNLLEDEKTIDINLELDENWYKELKISKKAEDDLENAITVWENLGKIDIRLARDNRLWVYLNHTAGSEWIKVRRIIENTRGDVETNIDNHFFGTTPRERERSGGLSGLWYRGYIASKIESLKLRDALEVILLNTDMFNNIIGRPSILKSHKVLNMLINVSKKIIDRGEQDFFSRKDKKGKGYLGWFKDINFEGGYKLLDGLSDEHLEDLFMKIASENK